MAAVSKGMIRTTANFGAEALANFVLPYVVFIKAEPSMGQVHALLLSSAPPIVWSLIEFARKRRVDALSVLVIAGIALSLLAFLGGGSVRFLQLRENLVTGLIGLVFLGSAAIGKPLVYQLARASMRRKSASDAEHFEQLRDNTGFRRGMTVMTLVWGFGLLVQTVVASVLVYAMSVRDYLIVSPFLGYGTMGGLALWTFWYGRRGKHRGEAARQGAQPR